MCLRVILPIGAVTLPFLSLFSIILDQLQLVNPHLHYHHCPTGHRPQQSCLHLPQTPSSCWSHLSSQRHSSAPLQAFHSSCLPGTRRTSLLVCMVLFLFSSRNSIFGFIWVSSFLVAWRSSSPFNFPDTEEDPHCLLFELNSLLLWGRWQLLLVTAPD